MAFTIVGASSSELLKSSLRLGVQYLNRHRYDDPLPPSHNGKADIVYEKAYGIPGSSGKLLGSLEYGEIDIMPVRAGRRSIFPSGQAFNPPTLPGQ